MKKAIIDEMNENLSDFDKYEELQEKQRRLQKTPYLIWKMQINTEKS